MCPSDRPAPALLPAGCLYLPGFLDPAEADLLFTRLRERVAWQQETLRMHGRECRVRRLVAWCGNVGVNYRYAGADHVCAGWLPELDGVRARIERASGFVAGLALLNRYRDGADGMGWHTDDEPGQGDRVASLSLGAVRRFRLRPHRGAISCGVDLGHGALLVMPAAWPHALPKTRRAIGERINVTWRAIADGWRRAR